MRGVGNHNRLGCSTAQQGSGLACRHSTAGWAQPRAARARPAAAAAGVAAGALRAAHRHGAAGAALAGLAGCLRAVQQQQQRQEGESPRPAAGHFLARSRPSGTPAIRARSAQRVGPHSSRIEAGQHCQQAGALGSPAHSRQAGGRPCTCMQCCLSRLHHPERIPPPAGSPSHPQGSWCGEAFCKPPRGSKPQLEASVRGANSSTWLRPC